MKKNKKKMQKKNKNKYWNIRKILDIQNESKN